MLITYIYNRHFGNTLFELFVIFCNGWDVIPCRPNRYPVCTFFFFLLLLPQLLCMFNCRYEKCNTVVFVSYLSGVPRNLRNDLLVAADSITNTMSSLVKELHSGRPPLRCLHQNPLAHAPIGCHRLTALCVWTPTVDDRLEEEEENLRNGRDKGEPRLFSLPLSKIKPCVRAIFQIDGSFDCCVPRAREYPITIIAYVMVTVCLS